MRLKALAFADAVDGYPTTAANRVGSTDGYPSGARAARGFERDGSDADAWVEQWLIHRRRSGMGSVRDNESHWRIHIRPVLHGPVDEWAEHDLRRLVSSLDQKVREGGVWPIQRSYWVALFFVFTPFDTTAVCKVVETRDGVLWGPENQAEFHRRGLPDASRSTIGFRCTAPLVVFKGRDC